MKKKIIPLVLAMASTQALALGQNGHRVVAHIAEQNLTAQAKKEIQKLVNNVPLAKLSTWPDEIRSDDKWKHTTSWHYISVADDEKVSEAKRSDKGDILEAMQRMTTTMKSNSASEAEKWQALAFYIHFVGDIHQPLHVGRKEDKGGNDVKVSWFGDYSNLHKVWDTDLIEYQNMSYTEYADFIDDVSQEKIDQWQNSSEQDWAVESWRLRQKIYNIPKSGRLHYEFTYINSPIINERMAQAGFRLAAKLNKIFGKK